MVTIYLGLVNWLVTILLVESEVCRPIRDWVNTRYARAGGLSTWIPNVKDDGWRLVLWYKAKYFVACQLCTGTWVGLGLALVTPWNKPLGHGVIGVLLAGLLYKAIGHIILIMQNTLKVLEDIRGSTTK